MISLLGAGTRIHGLPAHLRAGLASDVLDNLGGDMGGGATETEGENDDTTSKPTPTASGTSISVAEAPFTVAGEFTAMAANLAARPEAGSVSSQVTDLYYEPPTGRVKLAHVTVVETRALPIWTERGTPKPEQVTEWDRFRAAIAVHEQGHVDIDMKTFANAHRKAIGLSQADANTNIDGVVTAANNANHDYDTDNDHGRKAGTKIDGNVGVGMIKVP